jgi:outer membrane protein assembly factor BamB
MLKQLLSVLFFGITLQALAQQGKFIDASTGINYPFTVRQFSTAEGGLPQSSVIDIKQKADGTLFVLTANGIVSYDGSRFVPVTENKLYLQKYNMQLLWSEQHKQLYTISASGYFYRVLPEMKRFEISGEVLVHGITDVKNNRLLLPTQSGNLYAFDLATEKITWLLSFPGLAITSIGEYKNNYYVSNRNALFRISPDLKQRDTLLRNDEIIRMQYNGWDKKYYFIGQKAIYKYDGINKPDTAYVFPRTRPAITGLCMLFIDSVTGLIGTNQGLHYYNSNSGAVFNKDNGMPSSYFQVLLFDTVNNAIFAGTGERGLLRMQLKTALSYYTAEGISPSSMNSIVEIEPGRILASTNCCNIIEKQGKTFVHYAEKSAGYTCIGVVNHSIYAGTAGSGVYIFNGPDFVRSVTSPELASNYASCVFQDSDGEVWIGNNRGLSRGRGAEFKPAFGDQLREKVITVCEKRDGSLLVGGECGMWQVAPDKKTITRLYPISAFSGAKEIRFFYEDAAGKIWICTYNGGLYCYNGSNLRHINSMKNCRLPLDPFCLARDNFGYLNITSNTCLYRVHETDLDAFYSGKIEYLIPFMYRNDQGIMNTEFNGGFQNNFLKASNGKLYFPTIEGLCEFTPNQPRTKPIRPLLISLRIDEKTDHTGIRDIPRMHSSILFEFRCVCLSPRNNVYYQYRLDGLDDTWSELQKGSEVRYNQLPPGNYVFRARAIDAFNNVNPEELQYAFRVLPHFYETRWFLVTAVIVFLGITILIGRLRVQFYRRRAEAKEKNEKQIAILELKAIQAQMNPHFIFNCLSSIKYYIVSNETEKADNLLVRFSLLIRKFLDYSNSIITTLERETQLLTEYLHVEQLRAGGAFSYSVICPPTLLQESIPSFIIQPFVENSIKHGIGNRTSGKGEIIVRFTDMVTEIICEVEDNGVGREYTRAFGGNNDQQKTSKGIALVYEKTSLINAKYKLYISIVIEDKKNNAGEATGTRVILTIPKYVYSSDN